MLIIIANILIFVYPLTKYQLKCPFLEKGVILNVSTRGCSQRWLVERGDACRKTGNIQRTRKAERQA